MAEGRILCTMFNSILFNAIKKGFYSWGNILKHQLTKLCVIYMACSWSYLFYLIWDLCEVRLYAEQGQWAAFACRSLADARLPRPTENSSDCSWQDRAASSPWKGRSREHFQSGLPVCPEHLVSVCTNQWGRLEVSDDGVVSDWQVELVATQDEAVVDGVTHQVDAGSHDERDDAEVDRRTRQCPGAALNQLIGAASANNWWLFRLQANYSDASFVMYEACCFVFF